MFGLMRHAQRLPYCDTCKTLGSLYGQRSRLLLNHDTVFLAELLMEQSGQPEWNRAYRSFNCLTLPKSEDAMPLPLQYAATAAVTIAHFHIADHQVDSGLLRWRIAARYFSPTYRRAAARLRAWNFTLDKMTAILSTQTAREARAESLAHVAEPTASATAMIFSHGSRLMGRADLAANMYRLGHAFGYLAYMLDAFEDRERDRKSGAFNPFLELPASVARGQVLAATAEVERSYRRNSPPAFAPMSRNASVFDRASSSVIAAANQCRIVGETQSRSPAHCAIASILPRSKARRFLPAYRCSPSFFRIRSVERKAGVTAWVWE
jgi:hypothetical protein